MDDPAKVVIVLSSFATVAYSISAIARAAVANRKESARLARELVPPLAEARLERIEQAVDAIALEVERISEGQRFTTRLLSEQSHASPKPPPRQLSVNTPT
jgi:acyl-CoA reductase-like NAD-dependent aldehyde dehydrogenase